MNPQVNEQKIIDFPLPSAYVPGNGNHAHLFAPRFAPAINPDTLSTSLEVVVEQLQAKAAQLNMTAIFTDEFGTLIPELAETELGQTYYELLDQFDAAQWREVARPWIRRGMFITLGIGVTWLSWRYAKRRGWTTGLENGVRRFTNSVFRRQSNPLGMDGDVTDQADGGRDAQRQIMKQILDSCGDGRSQVVITVPDGDTAEAYMGTLQTQKKGLYRFTGYRQEDEPVSIIFHKKDLLFVNTGISEEDSLASFTIGQIEMIEPAAEAGRAKKKKKGKGRDNKEVAAEAAG
jgi:hypothetical protein